MCDNRSEWGLDHDWCALRTSIGVAVWLALRLRRLSEDIPDWMKMALERPFASATWEASLQRGQRQRCKAFFFAKIRKFRARKLELRP